jgi:DnaJ like chaperone protein
VVAAERDPYEVLGLDPEVNDAGLERRYRALLADNQPDKLVARGVPQEFVAIAVEKLAAIEEAYAAIAKQRGL